MRRTLVVLALALAAAAVWVPRGAALTDCNSNSSIWCMGNANVNCGPAYACPPATECPLPVEHEFSCYNGNLNVNALDETHIPTIDQMRERLDRYVIRITDDSPSYNSNVNGAWAATQSVAQRVEAEEPLQVKTIAEFRQLLIDEAARFGSGLAKHYIGELLAEDYYVTNLTFQHFLSGNTTQMPVNHGGKITIRAATEARHAGRPGATGEHARVVWQINGSAWSNAFVIAFRRGEFEFDGIEFALDGTPNAGADLMVLTSQANSSPAPTTRVTGCLFTMTAGSTTCNPIQIQSPNSTAAGTTIDNNQFYIAGNMGPAIHLGTGHNHAGPLCILNNTIIRNHQAGIRFGSGSTVASSGMIKNNYVGSVQGSPTDPDYDLDGTLNAAVAANASSDSTAPSSSDVQHSVAVSSYFSQLPATGTAIGYARKAGPSPGNQLDGNAVKLQTRYPRDGSAWYGIDILGVARSEDPTQAWDIGAEEFVRHSADISANECILPTLAFDTYESARTTVDFHCVNDLEAYTYAGYRVWSKTVEHEEEDFTFKLIERGANRWRVVYEPEEGATLLEDVLFPYTFSTEALGSSTTDDIVLVPGRSFGNGSIAYRYDTYKYNYTNDLGPAYYPDNFPLLIRTEQLTVNNDSQAKSEIMAAADWPFKKPAVRSQYRPGSGRGGGAISYGGPFDSLDAVWARFQAGGPNAAQPSWMAAAEAYKSVVWAQLWREGLLPPVFPDRMRKSHGFMSNGVQDAPYAATTNQALREWCENKDHLNWVIFGGQMSQLGPVSGGCGEVFDCDLMNGPGEDEYACCSPTIGWHPRFSIPGNPCCNFSLCDLVTAIRDDGADVGFYTRPWEGCRPRDYLDTPSALDSSYWTPPCWQENYIAGRDPFNWTPLQWLRNWQSVMVSLGASSSYLDVIHLDWASNSLWMAWLMRAEFTTAPGSSADQLMYVTEFGRELLINAHEFSGNLARIDAGIEPETHDYFIDPRYYTIERLLDDDNSNCVNVTPFQTDPQSQEELCPSFIKFPELTAYLLNDHPIFAGNWNGAHTALGDGPLDDGLDPTYANAYYVERKAFLCGFRLNANYWDPRPEMLQIVEARDDNTPPYDGLWFWDKEPRFQGTRGVVINSGTTSGVSITRFESEADGSGNVTTWLAIDLGDNYCPAGGCSTASINVTLTDLGPCTKSFTVSKNQLVHLYQVASCP